MLKGVGAGPEATPPLPAIAILGRLADSASCKEVACPLLEDLGVLPRIFAREEWVDKLPPMDENMELVISPRSIEPIPLEAELLTVRGEGLVELCPPEGRLMV